jgi:hypothetical protein
MRNSRLGIQRRAIPARFFTPVQHSVLQRKGDGSSGLAERCSKNSKDVENNEPLTTQRHDFGRVRVHSDSQMATTPSLNVNGAVALDAARVGAGIFINGPDKETTPKPAPKPKPKPQPKKPACPTDIQVIHIEQLTDPQFGKNNMLTGIGAVAYMEVLPSSTDWDGTLIRETVKQTKNTCGARARKVCSNISGEDVDFKVGAETKVINTKMDALRNTFYDLHMFALTDHSILHELGKDSCEVQCEQSYSCGGKKFGPDFTISYTGSKDTVAGTYDVTRIRVDKKAKAVPANP